LAVQAHSRRGPSRSVGEGETDKDWMGPSGPNTIRAGLLKDMVLGRLRVNPGPLYLGPSIQNCNSSLV
jgi:hypothetical protein